MNESLKFPNDEIFLRKLKFLLASSYHEYDLHYDISDEDFHRFDFKVNLSANKKWVIWERRFGEIDSDHFDYEREEIEYFLYKLGEKELLSFGHCVYNYLLEGSHNEHREISGSHLTWKSDGIISFNELNEEYNLNELEESKIQEIFEEKNKALNIKKPIKINEKIYRNIEQRKLKWQTRSIFAGLEKSIFFLSEKESTPKVKHVPWVIPKSMIMNFICLE